MKSQYMKKASELSTMSVARRLKVGCLISPPDFALSLNGIGYNSMPQGFDENCEIELPDGQLQSRPEVIHAEVMAANMLIEQNIPVEGSTVYITHSPCLACATLLIDLKVAKVAFGDAYRSNSGVLALLEAGIEVYQYENVTENFEPILG